MGGGEAYEILVPCDGKFKGRFNGYTGKKWHMLPLVDTTYLVIEIRKWVGRWLEILVEGDTRMEGWIFQHKGRGQMNIHDMDEGFKEALREIMREKWGLYQKELTWEKK